MANKEQEDGLHNYDITRFTRFTRFTNLKIILHDIVLDSNFIRIN